MNKDEIKMKIICFLLIASVVLVFCLTTVLNDKRNLTRQTSSLRTEITQLKEDNDVLTKKISDNENLLVFYTNKINSLQSSLDENLQKLKDLQHQYELLQSENRLLLSDKSRLERAVQRLRDERSILEENINLLLSQLDKLKENETDTIHHFFNAFVFNDLFYSKNSDVPYQTLPRTYIQDLHDNKLACYTCNSVVGYTYCVEWTNCQIENGVFVGVYLNGNLIYTYPCGLNKDSTFTIEITQDIESLVFYYSLTDDLPSILPECSYDLSPL